MTDRPDSVSLASTPLGRAVRLAVIGFAAVDIVVDGVMLVGQPLLVALTVCSSAAAVALVFRRRIGAILAIVPLVADPFLVGAAPGVGPMAIMSVVFASRARPREALVVLTPVAILRVVDLVWLRPGAEASFSLLSLFGGCVLLGLGIRWLLAHARTTSAQLDQLENRVLAVRQDERENLAQELSGLLADDLVATEALLMQPVSSGEELAELTEVNLRARRSLSNLRRLVSSLRDASQTDHAADGLIAAVEEAEDQLVGMGIPVEVELPSELPEATQMGRETVLAALQGFTDQVRENEAGGTVLLGLTGGANARLTAAYRAEDGTRVGSSESALDALATRLGVDRQMSGTGWGLVIGLGPAAREPTTVPSPPRLRFLARLKPNNLRAMLAVAVMLVVFPTLPGLDLGGPSNGLASGVVLVLSLTGLTVSLWRPVAGALVMAGALLAGVLTMAPHLHVSGLYFAVLFLSVVVAVHWPKLVPWFGAVCLLVAVAWYPTYDGDVPFLLVPLLFLVPVLIGAPLGIILRYFMRVRQVQLADFDRLTAEYRNARAAERAQLAGELHDIVAHQLSLMTMTLMAHGTSRDPEEIAATRERLLALNSSAQADLATLIVLTRQMPIRVREPGVAPASAANATAATLRSHGHDVTVEVSPSSDAVDDIDQAAKHTTSRVLREAATNILRYAPPGTPVEIELSATPGVGLYVKISSVLPAVRGEHRDSTGFGLLGLAERAAVTGATFSAGPEGPRWVVAASVPGDTVVEPASRPRTGSALKRLRPSLSFRSGAAAPGL